jgi:hypothetical protein
MFPVELVTNHWHYYTFRLYQDPHTVGDWRGKKAPDGRPYFYRASVRSDEWWHAECAFRDAYRWIHKREYPSGVQDGIMVCCTDHNNIFPDCFGRVGEPFNKKQRR